jgi:hypothetical protein
VLIEEEDKLARDLEQLEFAETRAAKGRKRLNHVRTIRDGLVPGSVEHLQAERLVVNFEAIQKLLEEFCHRLRHRTREQPSLR